MAASAVSRYDATSFFCQFRNRRPPRDRARNPETEKPSDEDRTLRTRRERPLADPPEQIMMPPSGGETVRISSRRIPVVDITKRGNHGYKWSCGELRSADSAKDGFDRDESVKLNGKEKFHRIICFYEYGDFFFFFFFKEAGFFRLLDLIFLC